MKVSVQETCCKYPEGAGLVQLKIRPPSLDSEIKDNSKPSMALQEAYENASDLLEETYKGSGIILGVVRRDI